jgi:WD40 repeat protein
VGVHSYRDFDVLLEPADGRGAYRARVVSSPVGGTSPVGFSVPFSPSELERFLLRIGQPRRRGIRRRDPPQTAAIKRFGGQLFEALFRGELRESLLRSLPDTRSQRVGLRIRLRLAEVPELASLPWEFLYDRRRNRFLCLSTSTPLVRYLEVSEPRRALAVSPPLRVLVMISSPGDDGYEPLDVEQEWSKLGEALADLVAGGRVVLERLEVADLSSLQRRLRRGDWHVFHFIGHGGFDPDLGDGVLICQDERGHAREVRGEQLGALLSNHHPMRLAVLNACEGARGDGADPFAGTAQSLIQQTLDAVVAMQFEITDKAAIVFARELYGAVADGFPLEAAVAEGRLAIRNQVSEVEWATPVLYSRAPDGRIFDIAPAAPAAPPRARPTRAAAAAGREAVAVADAAAVVVRHSRVVNAVAFSPDGRWLATGSNDGDARIWDAAGGRDRLRLPHGSAVSSVAFSPDGRWLATGSQDGSARIWDAAGVEERLCLSHRSAVSSVAFSPDGRWLATGGNDGDARIWDAASGRERVSIGRSRDSLFGAVFAAQLGCVGGVAFSRDGRWLATGCGHSGYVWDPVSARKRASVRHGSTVSSVAFSPDGRLLATGSTDATARTWDAASGEERRTFPHELAVTAVAFSPDGRLLATAGDDGRARVWDAVSGAERTSVQHRSRRRVTSVVFSPDGHRLATGGSDCTARIWSLQ